MTTKTRSTLYTEERVRNARRNIAAHDWARTEMERAIGAADRFAALGYEALWELVLPQTLPRSIWVHDRLGSPVVGKEALIKYGYYGWELNPDGKPWKILDPGSGYVFPTNDFEAFYRSGLDEHGIFDRSRADERLLVNVSYPERGPAWGVDDGFGWIDENGEKWTFVAYYAHWHYRRTLETAVAALRDAYLYTGEPRYARAGLILLDRLADLWPSYDLSVWKWEDGYRNSHGMTGQGKFIGCIWECISVKVWISAYDAFFPAADDPELVAFLSGQARRYGLPDPKDSGAAIRENIERHLVRSVLADVRAARIRGNHGMHESALAMAAVVLDDPGTRTHPGATRRILEFLFRSGGYDPASGRITGCNVLGTLVDAVDRDGMGNEGSPSYNLLWADGFLQIAEILRGYDGVKGVDLYQNVKMKKLLTAQHSLPMLGKYTPAIGDTGNVGGLGTILRLDHYVKAFEIYREPELAQVAHFVAGKGREALRGDIFAADPERTAREIAQAVEVHGPWEPGSVNLTGYGFAALRDGRAGHGAGEGGAAKETRRGVWLKYGRNRMGHSHADDLNIDVYAYGLDLAPDLGYPEQATPNPKRLDWTANTVSHNTVVVDRAKQHDSWVGIPRHFDGEGPVQLIDVESPRAYPQTELYRRTVALIRIDEERSYVVDFFHVKGGREHHYVFHGSQGTARTEGLNLEEQGPGTYAGPGVPFGHKVDESGFEWLREVRRDPSPAEVFTVDWAIEDFRGAATADDVHLRLTMLTPVDSVALAEGEPPQREGNPASLTYMIAHRAGEGRPSGEASQAGASARTGEGLHSVFVAVIEPCAGRPSVVGVRSLPVAPLGVPASASSAQQPDAVRAIEVTLDTGRVDTIVTSLDPEQTYVVDGRLVFRGFFGVERRRADRTTRGAAGEIGAVGGVGEVGEKSETGEVGENAENGENGDAKERVWRYLHEGDTLGHAGNGWPQGRLHGRVIDFTRELALENQIVVRFESAGGNGDSGNGNAAAGAGALSLPPEIDLAGHFIYVENDGERNAVYEIRGARRRDGGEVVLEIGDATLVRGHKDPADPEQGYVYDVAPGARFYIPLTWVAGGEAAPWEHARRRPRLDP